MLTIVAGESFNGPAVCGHYVPGVALQWCGTTRAQATGFFRCCNQGRHAACTDLGARTNRALAAPHRPIAFIGQKAFHAAFITVATLAARWHCNIAKDHHNGIAAAEADGNSNITSCAAGALATTKTCCWACSWFAKADRGFTFAWACCTWGLTASATLT